jgi:carbamate kinase
MRVVAALGGNALLRRGEPADAETQRANIEVAARSLAALAADHEIVVTHGNGPQVGLLALQAEAYEDVAPYPLDVLGAESEGMIGYLLEQGLDNALPGRDVCTLLTQVVVDPDDAAFSHPSKPVGKVYSEAEAARLARERGWAIAADETGWRRVVPSPEPLRIVELRAIQLLVDAGVLVVCVGGGGVPVTTNGAGLLRGIDAVVDKDLAAALLATELRADALLLLTDVPAVEVGHGTPDSRPLRTATPDELRALHLARGSMGPKAEAAARFAETRSGFAAIGALTDASALLAGSAGTRVVQACDAMDVRR